MKNSNMCMFQRERESACVSANLVESEFYGKEAREERESCYS